MIAQFQNYHFDFRVFDEANSAFQAFSLKQIFLLVNTKLKVYELFSTEAIHNQLMLDALLANFTLYILQLRSGSIKLSLARFFEARPAKLV